MDFKEKNIYMFCRAKLTLFTGKVAGMVPGSALMWLEIISPYQLSLSLSSYTVLYT